MQVGNGYTAGVCPQAQSYDHKTPSFDRIIHFTEWVNQTLTTGSVQVLV